MRLCLLFLACTFASSWLDSEAALAQMQGRGPTLGTGIRPPPETPQQKAQKSAACKAKADGSDLRGSDRTSYLKFCNSSPYSGSDFHPPDLDIWKQFKK
jgi:hypothetical protein